MPQRGFRCLAFVFWHETLLLKRTTNFWLQVYPASGSRFRTGSAVKTPLRQNITKKRLLNLTFDSYQKGIIIQKCVSYDYAISKRYKDGNFRYHFHDLDSPDGKHNLSILPAQVILIELLNNYFDPAHYITWTPSWSLSRDWGIYS